MENAKKTKKKQVTEKELLERIAACQQTIDRQTKRIASYRKKIDSMRQKALLEAIENSGKTLDDVYAFLKQ